MALWTDNCGRYGGRGRENRRKEQNVFIAVDGGGTKTELLLLDDAFREINRHTCGCTNHERLRGGYGEAGRVLGEGVRALLQGSGAAPAEIRDLVAGIAGVDTEADEQAYGTELHRLGFRRFLAVNDGYLPIKANAPGGIGIAYNCGTGVCCNAIGAHGEMTKTGGLDEWAGDAGGGRWIAQQVFTAVYDSRVLKVRETLLDTLYGEAFPCGDETGLIDSLMRLKREEERQRQAVRMLFAAAGQGDAVARGIAEHMIERAVAYIAAAVRRTSFGDGEIPVILTGSILLKAADEWFLRELEERIREIPRRIRVLRAAREPVEGAARWLKERAGERGVCITKLCT